MGRHAKPDDDLPFACACGAVTGVIDRPGPRAGDHVVCHCGDCQAFAIRFGAADRILDTHGGTALYQGRCATMRVLSGRARLGCVHLTSKPTLRWYARCCGTPMFNTYRNGRIPYITTILANADPAQRAILLGPPLGHLFVVEATGNASGLPPLAMRRLMRRFLRRMLLDIVSGARRRAALFDSATLAPIAVPERLVTGSARSPASPR